ncbi:uncharacterized protein [Nicotiana sylvestris]|uniref:Uncharacterized protein LOC104238736 n=1 Tax=Nicotiana sylvestris TaxID=4096 RepID=A0A1U7XY99_NICSY|nr:PREDICTED: uncharacterized protein LOC104238736 [Nicotiana sylvestris]
MVSDSSCCFYYSDETKAMAILIHFCISRRVRRSSFHYALAFPVRSPYLRSGVRRALASVHHLSSKVWVSYSGWLEARWHFEGR